MKCSECVRTGQRSILRSYGGITSTSMGGTDRYYDEDGNHHYHEVNKSCTSYRCSNGHIHDCMWIPKCPNCNYGGDEKWTLHNEPQ